MANNLPKKYETKQSKLDKHHELLLKLLPLVNICPVCGETLSGAK